jgi:hypothetical protein
MTAKTICSENGCPELVDLALERCPEHRVDTPILAEADRSLIRTFASLGPVEGLDHDVAEEVIAIAGDVSLLHDRVFAIRKALAVS